MSKTAQRQEFDLVIVGASFDTIFSVYKQVTADMGPTDRRKLFHHNAARIYRPA